jgi:hypothetical protein
VLCDAAVLCWTDLNGGRYWAACKTSVVGCGKGSLLTKLPQSATCNAQAARSKEQGARSKEQGARSMEHGGVPDHMHETDLGLGARRPALAASPLCREDDSFRRGRQTDPLQTGTFT